jgi:hypothetical protein
MSSSIITKVVEEIMNCRMTYRNRFKWHLLNGIFNGIDAE